MITLAPYDVLFIARAAGVSTAEAVSRFTIRRGSLLRFGADGACAALSGTRCSIHHGRPLACRLYPLGLDRSVGGRIEKLTALEPALGSRGVYGTSGTVGDFLEAQDTIEYLVANDRYRCLIPQIRARIIDLIDFDSIEPREFWRRAIREALAETGYDPNPLIDAMFDPDGLVGRRDDEESEMLVHLAALGVRIGKIADAAALAAAAVILAVSLGFTPSEAIGS